MESRVIVDTVALRIECASGHHQKAVVSSIIRGMNSINKVFRGKVESRYGYSRTEIYHDSKIIATISTSMYARTKKFYVTLRFAGLVSHDKYRDRFSARFLYKSCAYLKKEAIAYRLVELDVCIDVWSPFKHLEVICVKKAPKTNYYTPLSNQKYDTTTYIEQISKKQLKTAARRAYFYDKSKKENIEDVDITRFEIKLLPRFFYNKDCWSVESIKKVLDKYYVMYFRSMEKKHTLLGRYNRYTNIRKEQLDNIGLDKHRIAYDMSEVRRFMRWIKYQG